MCKKGFVLPVAILLVMIALSLGYVLYQLSMSNLMMIKRTSDKERLYHVATGGLNYSRRIVERVFWRLNQRVQHPDQILTEASPTVGKILQQILDDDQKLEPREHELELDISPYVSRLNLEGDLNLSVTLQIKPQYPLNVKTSETGIQMDPHEMIHLVIIRAKAEFPDVSQSVSDFIYMQSMSIMPPVLPKFSLFLRKQGELNLNRIQDSRKPELLESLPFQVRTTSVPFSLATSPVSRVSDVTRHNSWVYFGGMELWRFNLGEYGRSADFFETSLSRKRHTYTPPAGTKPGIKLFSTNSGMFREIEKHSIFELVADTDLANSASIQFNGGVVKTAPTMFLGNAVRKWLLIQGVQISFEENTFLSYFPYLDEATFNSNSWPASVDPSPVRSMYPNYSDYAKRMSMVFETDFNSGNLNALHGEGSAFKKVLIITKNTLEKKNIQVPPKLQEVEVNHNSGDPFGLVYGKSYTLRNEKERVIFQNADLGSIQDLQFLKVRSQYLFADQASFEEKLRKDGRVDLDGLISLEGDLVIEEDMVFPRGGTILVEGQIKVRANVKVENEAPLFLVSLTSDIHVMNGMEVEAGLIAMQGRVNFPATFLVRGMVAANELGLVEKSKLPRELIYNGNMNLTHHVVDLTHFFIYLRIIGRDLYDEMDSFHTRCPNLLSTRY